MKTKYRLILEEKINEFIDEIDDFPFYIGSKTVKHMVDSVAVVFDAMEEAAKLEVENQIEGD